MMKTWRKAVAALAVALCLCCACFSQELQRTARQDGQGSPGSTDELFQSVTTSLDGLEKALGDLTRNNGLLRLQLESANESLASLRQYSAMREAQYSLLEKECDELRRTTVGWRLFSIVTVSVAVPAVVALTVALVNK